MSSTFATSQDVSTSCRGGHDEPLSLCCLFMCVFFLLYFFFFFFDTVVVLLFIFSRKRMYGRVAMRPLTNVTPT